MTDNYKIDESGNITGSFVLKIGKEEFEVPINTTLEIITQKQKNREDPNSRAKAIVEDDETVLPFKGFFEEFVLGTIGLDKDIGNRMFEINCKAMEENFNNVIVKKADYERILVNKQKSASDNFIMRRTADLNNIGIALEKEGRIDEAIAVYEENIRLGYPASYSFSRLSALYRKRKDYFNWKRITIRRFEVYDLSKEDLDTELKQIENMSSGIHPLPIYPQKSIPVLITGIPMGVQFENIIKHLPEFNFYFDKSEREETIHYLMRHSEILNEKTYRPKLFEIKLFFNELINEAEKFEKHYKLDAASYVYERIISEQYYATSPYEKLIRIYKNANLIEDLHRVLTISINHFSHLRDMRKSYVIGLAKKYDKMEYALQRIKSGQKIMYYAGSFELYNGFPIVERWQQQINKL